MATALSADSVAAALTGSFGAPCKVFDRIGSTNDEALSWALDGAPEGALVVTEHQTSGRGRRGRVWFDAPGSSLLFSLVLRPEMRFERLGLLSLALGNACADAVESVAGVPAKTKWPNDVVIGDRKIAGILVETKLIGSDVDVAIAGIGLNYDWTGGEIPREIERGATTLVAEASAAGMDVAPAREELLAAILRSLEDLYPLVRTSTDELLRRAEQRSAVLGGHVTIRFADGDLLHGRATRLLSDGALEIETDEGVRSVHVGEIEQLRPA